MEPSGPTSCLSARARSVGCCCLGCQNADASIGIRPLASFGPFCPDASFADPQNPSSAPTKPSCSNGPSGFLGSLQFGSIRFSWVQLGSVRLGSAWFGLVRLSLLVGCDWRLRKWPSGSLVAPFAQPKPTQMKPLKWLATSIGTHENQQVQRPKRVRNNVRTRQLVGPNRLIHLSVCELAVGFWVLDVGCSVLGALCWMLAE